MAIGGVPLYVRAPSGSTGRPGLGFTFDDDTGLYLSAANEITVVNGGTPTLTIDQFGDLIPQQPASQFGNALNAWGDYYMNGVLHGVASAATAWTPTLTAATPPVLGTGGTSTGSLFVWGKLTVVTFNIHFGSGGGFTAGSGTYTISNVPVTTDSTYYGTRHAIGVWSIRQGTSGTVYSGQARTVGGASVTINFNVSAGGSVTQNETSVGGPAGTWPSATDFEGTVIFMAA